MVGVEIDRGGERARCFAIASVCVIANRAVAGDGSSRFAIDAEWHPVVVSADGRFGLQAAACYAPEAQSAEGRYTPRP
jgi:hypothetical protein